MTKLSNGESFKFDKNMPIVPNIKDDEKYEKILKDYFMSEITDTSKHTYLQFVYWAKIIAHISTSLDKWYESGSKGEETNFNKDMFYCEQNNMTL